MYDIDLIRVVLNKDKWDRFNEYVKKHNVSRYTRDVLDVIKDYWDTYPEHTTIDISSLKSLFFIIKGKTIKDPAAYEALFQNLDESMTPVSEEMILKHLVEVDYATQIASEAEGHVLGVAGKSINNVGELFEKYEEEIGKATKPEDVFVSPSLSYVSSVASAPGLNWRLTEMNIGAGPLRKGDFCIVAARPEAGKTTFVASEATFMLSQLKEDEHVIWVNNEEASIKVMMRCIQAYNQVTTKDLLDDPAKYEKSFLDGGGNRFLIVGDDSPYRSVSRINSLLTKHKPGLIVFDQLDKVDGFKYEKEAYQRVGALYLWARELAKKYCPVIAISQLDGSAEGQKWVTMDHLRGSKTDKPGEADLIVMIGDERAGTLDRYITLAKNKLFGGPMSIEAHRHGNFVVGIEPTKARYVSKWTTK
jgi:replicative DNA helicase